MVDTSFLLVDTSFWMEHPDAAAEVEVEAGLGGAEVLAGHRRVLS